MGATPGTRVDGCDAGGFVASGSSIVRRAFGVDICGWVSDSGRDGDEDADEGGRRESEAARDGGLRPEGCQVGKAILMIEPKSTDRRKPVVVPMPSRDFSLITESPSAERVRISE